MFLSRATFDALRADRDYWRDEAKAAIAAHRALLASLADRTVPAPVPRPEPVKPREQDEADTAIEWRAQGDGQLRAYLARYAKQQRKAGVDPKVIADAIMKGEQASDDEGLPA